MTYEELLENYSEARKVDKKGKEISSEHIEALW